MTQGLPLWVTILVALGIPTLLVAMVGAGYKSYEAYRAWKTGRRAAREDRAEDREDRRDEREMSWNDKVRTNIERHIPWDAKMQAHVERLELLVNDLREGQGKPAVAFPTLGPPPDLFPAGVAPPRDDGA